MEIVLVEDNADVAESLSMLLEILGHRVRSFRQGLAALDVVASCPPDVMLVDIGLPDVEGYEVARRVRVRPELGGVVLVALTGYGGDDHRQASALAGFDHHLVKPVEPAALEALVARIAARSGESPAAR